MDIFELMENHKNQFSSTDARIYENIRKFPDIFASEKISIIVDKFGISQAALTRFAKRLGFDGFNVFQYQFRIDFQKANDSHTDSEANYYGEYLKNVEKSVSKKQLNILIQHIHNCQNIILAGSNLSNIPAKYFQYSMNFTTYKPAFVYYPSEGIIPATSNDIFILFSVNSGLAFKDYLKGIHQSDHRPYCILITFSKKHTLSKYFDEIVVLPEAHLNQTRYTVLPDTFGFLLFTDILLNEVTKSSENYTNMLSILSK